MDLGRNLFELSCAENETPKETTKGHIRGSAGEALMVTTELNPHREKPCAAKFAWFLHSFTHRAATQKQVLIVAHTNRSHTAPHSRAVPPHCPHSTRPARAPAQGSETRLRAAVHKDMEHIETLFHTIQYFYFK